MTVQCLESSRGLFFLWLLSAAIALTGCGRPSDNDNGGSPIGGSYTGPDCTGTTNVLAFNAAERMSKTEAPQFSPLYLKAATGQGKTHLLHAIGHGYLQAHPRARIFYCSAERFMIEFVQALRSNEMMEFKARLRAFDLLLVDDIQFIIGKAAAQEELLYTIDALLAEGKRLVFAADRAPQALDGVEPRLLSRLSMGLVADIQPADIELRRAILEHRLQRFSPADVPADAVTYYAGLLEKVSQTPEWKEFVTRTAQTGKFMKGKELADFVAKDEAANKKVFENEGWVAK